ncbi:MAG: hypothetical protein GQ542_07665 [Desulforhopalus sp.]|nr:hypothetical protein [Desulforhopalus sp.]
MVGCSTTRNFLIAAVILSIVVLSGCVSQKQSMINQGYPLSYADGFDDGCHSGNKAGGSMFEQFKKDVRRFEKDLQYAQGWSDGFRQCETEQEALQRQIRMSIEQQRLIETKKHNQWEEQRHLENEVLKGVDTNSLRTLQ